MTVESRREEHLLRDNVVLLAGQHEVHAVVVALEERQVLGVERSVILAFSVLVVTGEVLDDGLADGSALGREGQFQLLVLQYDVLARAVQRCVEHVGGVTFGSCLGLGLTVLFC